MKFFKFDQVKLVMGKWKFYQKELKKGQKENSDEEHEHDLWKQSCSSKTPSRRSFSRFHKRAINITVFL